MTANSAEDVLAMIKKAWLTSASPTTKSGALEFRKRSESGREMQDRATSD